MADSNVFVRVCIVSFCVFIVLTDNTQAQGACTTPDGSGGQCVEIFKCPALLSLLNKPNRSRQELDALRKAHCGFQGTNPLVCCATSDPVQIPKPDPPPTPKPSGNKCFTPDGQEGSCISLQSCSHLTKLLQDSRDNDAFVQNSKCPGSDKYSVCCGPLAPVVRPVVRPTVCTPTAFPPDPRTGCCGVESGGGNRIVGGNATSVDQYPWLAIIEYRKENKIKLLCGGGLISGRYVLTAGHCVVGPVLNVGRPVNVRLGEYDTSNSGPDCVEADGGGMDCTDGALIVPIEKIIAHHEYDPDHRLRRHDIALLRLTQTVQYSDFIRPICLPSTDLAVNSPSNSALFAAGWGAVSDTQSSSNIKLHVALPFKSQEECQVPYNHPARKVPLWEGQICAGGEKGKDSCKGDSGGPLMLENKEQFEVVGVVSFGPTPCGLENIPGVYTKVYEYLPWIRSQITP